MPEKYTRREHYVPELYLINFLDSDDRLWVYNKKEQRIFRCGLKDICVQKDLYETKWQTEKQFGGEYFLRNHLENRLCEKEGEYATMLRNLLTRCLNGWNGMDLHMEEKEQNIMFSFVANLYCRHPWYIAHQTEEVRKIDCETVPELAPFRELIELFGMGDIGTYVEAATKIATVDDALEAGPAAEAKKQLSQMEYCILASDHIPFITSDFPLLCGFANTEETVFTTVHFPFHPRFSVAFFDPERHPQLHKWRNQLRFVADEFVIKLNKQFLNQAELSEYLIAHNESDLTFCVQ